MRENTILENVKNPILKQIMIRAQCSYDAARRRWQKYSKGLITEDQLYALNNRILADNKRQTEQKELEELSKYRNFVENRTELIHYIMNVVQCSYSSARERVCAYEAKTILFEDLFRLKKSKLFAAKKIESKQEEEKDQEQQEHPEQQRLIEEQKVQKAAEEAQKFLKKDFVLYEPKRRDRYAEINGERVNLTALIREVRHRVNCHYETARSRVRQFELGLLSREALFAEKTTDFAVNFAKRGLKKVEESNSDLLQADSSKTENSPKIKNRYFESVNDQKIKALIEEAKLKAAQYSKESQSQKNVIDKKTQDALELRAKQKLQRQLELETEKYSHDRLYKDLKKQNVNWTIWLSYCPVTLGRETKMTKDSFIRVCEVKFNERYTSPTILKHSRCEYCQKDEKYWPTELKLIDISEF